MIIKVCGMRDPGNIRAVEKAGPDWMGFICWPKSSRFVGSSCSYLPQNVERIGVFVNQQIEEIQQMAASLHLNRIQLHGQESPAFCQQVWKETGLPIIKAISVSQPSDVQTAERYLDTAGISHLLFDTKCHCVGGSGKQFDWDVLQSYNGPLPFLLSGGISPEDAEKVQAFHHPRMVGIDINSRFEDAPAVKDTEKIMKFIQSVRKTPAQSQIKETI